MSGYPGDARQVGRIADNCLTRVRGAGSRGSVRAVVGLNPGLFLGDSAGLGLESAGKLGFRRSRDFSRASFEMTG